MLSKLERILERAERHLSALQAALQGRTASGSGEGSIEDVQSEKEDRGQIDVGVSVEDSVAEDLRAEGSKGDVLGDWEQFVMPDLSDVQSTAEAIQRCLVPLAAEAGTAVLSDTRGLLVAGVGTDEAQENLAAVGALAAQMAFRSAEFVAQLEPRTVVVAGRGKRVVGVTLFVVEDEFFVLALCAAARWHRTSRVKQVLSWIRPLLAGSVPQ